MKVAVAGGTGLAGRHVVAALANDGHEPVVLARSTGVDVVTGNGLAAALTGVEAVVDATNLLTMNRGKATTFFGAVSTSLTRVGLAAGVRHHVVLSIVGIDRVDTGYYAGKLEQ